jgi:hypothetical protein
VNKKIFICTSAYNDTDLDITLSTAFDRAANPEDVYFGIALQYPDLPMPDFSKYKNVRTSVIDIDYPIGTSPSRIPAAELIEDESYFLSIDCHTVFKKDWDKNLLEYHSILKENFDKPIISTYSPYWYRDSNGMFFNQNKNNSMDEEMPIYKLKFKENDELNNDFYIMPTPTWGDQVKDLYEEHYLIGAHLLFAESSYLKEVPFDPYITYHEENTTAMRAWTRGYRIFAINKDILWTREMYHGVVDEKSWRKKSFRVDKNGESYFDRIVRGAIRCKDILLGKEIGIYGAPSIELLKEYEAAAGINHEEVYKNIYDYVKNNYDRNFLAKQMYEMDVTKNQ